MKNSGIETIILAVGANGLGAIRSLALENNKFGIITLDKKDVSQYSRYPVIKHALIDNVMDSKETQLLDILKKYEKKSIVLIPTSDWLVTFLNNNRSYFERYFKIALPSEDVTNILIDKALEVDFISRILPIPKTLSNVPDSPDVLLKELMLPIIIKPRSHKFDFLGKKNAVLFTRDNILKFYANNQKILYSLIAQEIIPGTDKNLWVCNCTFDRFHKLRTAFIFRRFRTAPSHYGVTSCAVSEYNSQIIKYAKLLGDAIKYVGPAMIEFKFDERDHEYKYLELNPRIGMCNFFDTSCGVNNVYSAFEVALGKKEPRQISPHKDGIIFLDFHDDLYSRKCGGEKISHILIDYMLLFFKERVSLYFYWKDPLPAIFLGIRLIRRFITNGIRKFYKKILL